MAHTAKYSCVGFGPSVFEIARRLLAHPGKTHTPNVLLSYMSYYNGTRPHLSLNKDAPMLRSAETAGRILCRPILGGLHHQYTRI
ncbi:hypothetical protein [Nitrobacter sp. JJSN]|uniref:hypothetical protein n=1 Tax=Nitrobacter sp. JJSN TaxID=3453033 RepID=UPI003F766C39